MELTSKEHAVIYNALCTRRKELEKIINERPVLCSSAMEKVFKDIQDQIDTIDELFESGKF